eukprot:CAMPEP_0195289320 /NCGR_PEP_ID=MMETSP0707-20130614/5650_1 /TAXON_ID=33640 /ORGANISM="Asterionellopsis glacialis, Strain CCMP134" /LENGTH=339 /DNA_ID=CAMNT_0040349311 /DNA_START=124 /DNA_END=1139 /DNA_ORIENTATION=-
MSNSANNDELAASLEQLERTVREIEVLKAIYGSDHGDDNADSDTHQTHEFVVHSTQEMWNAQVAIGDEEEDEESDFMNTRVIPTLDVELRIIQESESSATRRGPQHTKQKMIRLRCKLAPGYPELCPATIVCVTIDGFYRSQQESIALQLQEKAEALLGQEAMMELVQEVQELVVSAVSLSSKEEPSTHQESSHHSSLSKRYKSRQWIWAHHITNTDRRKSIVNEAVELRLGGYLKSGYPGIVVVEGPSQDCSEFVSWIKGSKSRPGGFGRNWGHHVKGEIRIPLPPPDSYDGGDHNVDSTAIDEEKFNATETATPSQSSCQQLPIPFEDVGEDMKILS